MIGGVLNKKPSLYTSDVTGNYFSYYAHAIGENDERIREKLRDQYNRKDLTIKRGVKLALDIFKEIQGEKFNLERFELAYIKSDKDKLERIAGEQLKDFYSEKKKD